MARLIPLILIALAVWLWLRARRKTDAYMASYGSPARDAHGKDEGEGQEGPRAPAA
ncbi:hypothetical protein AB0D35_33230 [Streptomyces sp. NPDC048301]|uniref:hypothetical protein n=1 Tax=unclassified Streptomyces TaxID=2593676 RepID=UPI0034283238